MKKFFALFSVIILTLTLSSCTTLKLSKLSDTYFIMDTSCTITAGGADSKTLKKAIEDAFDKVYEIERLTDYYSDTSDVSKINKAKANDIVYVSDYTINILKAALDISDKTNGSFDITIAPIKDLWGFNNSNPTPPPYEKISEISAIVNYKNILIDTKEKTVTKTLDSTKIDLGGCAKGYAADIALDTLKKYDITYALIDLGGNILTYGNNPSNTDGRWRIGIQKPFSKNGEYADTVTVLNKAVVTSGTYQRYFNYNGEIFHHIINPHTGYPANNSIDSVTIVADSALLADCLSTASLIVGEEEAKNLANQYNAEIYIISK